MKIQHIRVSIPRGMMVILELSVLLNVLCSSSRAEIIFSIWARLSGLSVSGLILNLVLTPAVIVLIVVLSAALLLRSHCFKYRLGFSVEGLSGTADA